MVDNKTAHLALPLPDLSNMQDEDVPRIGRALSMLDTHAQQVDSALHGVDSALESQGRDVAELKVGSQDQAGSLELLARALETEKTERSEADGAASTKLQELATGQGDLDQRIDTVEIIAGAAKSVTDKAAAEPTAGAIPIAGSDKHLAPGWVGTMLCNKRLVITTSGNVVAPKTGWAKVKLIAGGGAGGDSDCSLGGKGGGAGGSTSLAGHTATGGSGGGAGSYACGAGGGGGYGEVIEFYVYMVEGVSIGTAVIGAGGVRSASPSPYGAGPRGGFGVNYGGNANWGTFGGGGGPGGGAGSGDVSSGFSGAGGHGGNNGTPYGGGGGGAKGFYSNAGLTGCSGRGGGNGADGQTGTGSGLTYGGNGGPGAIFIDYFDPDFAG